MSRSTSLTFRNAFNAQSTGEVPVLLLTLDHASLTEPIRVSTDNKDEFDVEGTTVRGTISRGEKFIFFPMQITLPDDSEETVNSAQITIDNIDRTILAEVRGMSDSPTVKMEVVLASSPDTVEASFSNFKFSSVNADVLTITGSLSLAHYWNEPAPGGSMLPSNFSGLF